MSGIPKVCPSCGRPPTGGQEMCADHGLYAVDPTAAARRDRAPLLGHVFADRYVMVDLLGDGGMGTVYRGVDQRLDREVAIKVLGAMAMLDEDDRARFEREAQALSRLHSEHTVTVYDYGVATRPALAGTAYIVLELVRGADLFEHIQTGPLTPAQASSIITDVGRSLDEAHSVGIIHRDIKPSNILLTSTPDGRHIAKVIDFGVARMDDGRRTRTGVMMGTPHYMAPEQCSGGDGRMKVDHRTDLYALGAVLFEIMVGEPPFDGQQPMHILFKQVNDPPPALPGNARSKLRKRLEAAIHTAMAKQNDQRQESVRAFTDEVAEAIAAYPDEAARSLVQAPATAPSLAPTMDPSTLAPFSAPSTNPFDAPSRSRWPLYAALSALAVVLAVLLVLVWMPDAPPGDPTPGDAPEKISLGSPTPVTPPVEAVEPAAPPPAVEADAGVPDAGTPDATPTAQPAPREGRRPTARRTRKRGRTTKPKAPVGSKPKGPGRVKVKGPKKNSTPGDNGSDGDDPLITPVDWQPPPVKRKPSQE